MRAGRHLIKKGFWPLIAAGALTSCTAPPPPPAQAAAPPAPIAAAPAPIVTGTPIPLLPAAPYQGAATQFYYGNGPTLGAAPTQASPYGAYPDQSNAGITLNFSNADVRDVAKTVLGDLLKLNYEIDPTVQGTITLTTASPVSRDAVLPIFEQSLLLAGLALVQQNDLYRIVPAADAPRQAGAPLIATPGAAISPGFGLEIVPLRYVAAAQMQTLLQPLVPAGSIISTDSTRNILLIAGTTDQRAAILQDVALFDVDQLAGKSFAIFHPHAVDAEDLVRGLNAIIAGPTGQTMAGVVQLIALDRLNAVLAISAQPQYLPELQQWVARLDQPSESNQQQLYVYRVQNGKAADLAAVLTAAFAPTAATAATQATPAAAPTTADNTLNPLLGSLSQSSSATPQGLPQAQLTTPQQTDDTTQDQSATPDASQQTAQQPEQESGFGADIKITADTINNALLIRCLPAEYAEIQQALAQLDVQPLQVMIEASVAEVTLTNQLQYGIQYYFKNSHVQVVQSNTASSAISAALPGFAAILQEGDSIPLILSALQALTTVTVLSAPEILVLNNQTASLQVGDEVPIETEQSQSTITSTASIINSIQYANTGVILKVTPRVNAGGLVTMDISQEVSQVATTTSSTLNTPTISERQIGTSVAIHDGQTVALGGLISDNRSNGKSGVPFLQNIPYLGNLFSTTSNSINRTELLVLLTPHVIGDADQAQAVTDELRAKLDETLPALANGR